ncbi:MAG: class I SAM-dependent methyltransferase [Proteobacteria bacterium]|nr:class I SAM-dependent methyltransferase [Pseudomonadota bacterium]
MSGRGRGQGARPIASSVAKAKGDASQYGGQAGRLNFIKFQFIMNLCFEIASRIYRYKNCHTAEHQRSVEEAQRDYWKWQYESSEKYFTKFGDLYERLQGKTVLDIGCGLGGRTAFLSTRGVQNIAGSEINHDEIDAAIHLIDEHDDLVDKDKINFVKVEEGKENSIGLFDVVLLVDAMEHLRNPQGTLNYAYSVTRPGGVCYFSTVGWYNHMASHVGSIIPVPFVTLFFSDEHILDAVKRIVQEPYYKPSMWDTMPPIDRWKNVNNLSDRPGEYLNKITVAEIKKLVRDSKFENAYVDVAGFDRWFMKPFNILAKIPVIQEVYHSGVFGRLEKALPRSYGGK